MRVLLEGNTLIRFRFLFTIATMFVYNFYHFSFAPYGIVK